MQIFGCQILVSMKVQAWYEGPLHVKRTIQIT